MSSALIWPVDEWRSVSLERLDERLRRYRLADPVQEQTLARSLERYGQLSPLVISVQDESWVLVDGFKRVGAARKLEGVDRLTARRIEVDEQGAKAAMYNLNRVGRRPVELEEAWIVQSLVREDGLSQVEVGRLLGRHKSWVNRRLSMLEQLFEGASEQLRLGLLTPALARQLTRLPRGNQSAALQTARDASLTCRELAGVVDLLLSSRTQEQAAFVLRDPRGALRQSRDHVAGWDPRLSPAGNQAAKQLGWLLEGLVRMDSWLRHRGRHELRDGDRNILCGVFQQLAAASRRVAEATANFLGEGEAP